MTARPVTSPALRGRRTRRHIRGALSAGATRDEILAVLQAVSVLGIHSMSLGAPILVEELAAQNAHGESEAGKT